MEDDLHVLQGRRDSGSSPHPLFCGYVMGPTLVHLWVYWVMPSSVKEVMDCCSGCKMKRETKG